MSMLYRALGGAVTGADRSIADAGTGKADLGRVVHEEDFAAACCDTEILRLEVVWSGDGEFLEVSRNRRGDALGLPSYANNIERCYCDEESVTPRRCARWWSIPSRPVSKLPDVADSIFCHAEISTGSIGRASS